jgi:hypothetical protein
MNGSQNTLPIGQYSGDGYYLVRRLVWSAVSNTGLQFHPPVLRACLLAFAFGLLQQHSKPAIPLRTRVPLSFPQREQQGQKTRLCFLKDSAEGSRRGNVMEELFAVAAT